MVIVGQIGPKVGLCPDFWEGGAEREEEGGPIRINHNTNCSTDISNISDVPNISDVSNLSDILNKLYTIGEEKLKYEVIISTNSNFT